MAQGKYITSQDLINRMTKKMYLAIYDEDKTGDVDSVNDSQVQQDIDGAEGEVDSYLVLIEGLPVPVGTKPKVDRLLKLAALDYAESLSFLRHPEYPRTFGENGKSRGLWAIAEKRMDRIKRSLQQLPDLVAKSGVVPSNTGGFVGVVDPRADEEDDEFDGRHFDDTGVF